MKTCLCLLTLSEGHDHLALLRGKALTFLTDVASTLAQGSEAAIWHSHQVVLAAMLNRLELGDKAGAFKRRLVEENS